MNNLRWRKGKIDFIKLGKVRYKLLSLTSNALL